MNTKFKKVSIATLNKPVSRNRTESNIQYTPKCQSKESDDKGYRISYGNINKSPATTQYVSTPSRQPNKLEPKSIQRIEEVQKAYAQLNKQYHKMQAKYERQKREMNDMIKKKLKQIETINMSLKQKQKSWQEEKNELLLYKRVSVKERQYFENQIRNIKSQNNRLRDQIKQLQKQKARQLQLHQECWQKSNLNDNDKLRYDRTRELSSKLQDCNSQIELQKAMLEKDELIKKIQYDFKRYKLSAEKEIRHLKMANEKIEEQHAQLLTTMQDNPIQMQSSNTTQCQMKYTPSDNNIQSNLLLARCQQLEARIRELQQSDIKLKINCQITSQQSNEVQTQQMVRTESIEFIVDFAEIETCTHLPLLEIQQM